MRATFRPYLLVVIGIVGLLLIVVAFTDVVFPWGGAGVPAPRPEPSSPAAENRATQPATATSTRSATPTSFPTATPTAIPTATPSAVPSATATPTSSLVAMSPPVAGPAGALAYVEGGKLTVHLPDESTVRTVAEGVMLGGPSPAWSPDGRRLLYLTRVDGSSVDGGPASQTPQLWDGQSGETLRLVRDVPSFPSDVAGVKDMAWSPTGARILFLFPSQAPSSDAWVLDVDTIRAWQLSSASIASATWIDDDTILYDTHDVNVSRLLKVGPPAQVLTETMVLDTSFSLSPDREYVASFESTSSGRKTLQIVALPGRAPLSLTHQPTITVSAQDPLWSPDGRWVAYGAGMVNGRAGEGPYMLMADTTGLRETRVFTGLLPEAWSPDGRLLAGFGCTDTTCRLSLIDTASAEATVLASGGAITLWDLAWSPRGVYLTYSLGGSGVDTAGLTLWNRATGERRLLLQSSREQPLTDLQWTADGCSVYAAKREEKVRVGLLVTAIWGIGPRWDEPWLVAPGLQENGLSQAATSGQRDANHGTVQCPGPLLDGRRLVAYYGTPLGPGLGILGRHGITETLRLLREQIQVYQDLDPTTETVPTYHLVVTIADDTAGPGQDYSHRVPPETTRRWITSIIAEGGWAILDVQPGRAPLPNEIQAIESFLMEPKTHLAVDPEFITEGDQVPGEDIGHITGAQINWIQARMDQVARTIGERKMLVIHQFADRMVEQKETILDYPLVDIVWDADGFGTPASKIYDYNQYKRETGFEYGGFKLFYRYDDPLMTPEQVLSLEPPPRLVIYQ